MSKKTLNTLSWIILIAAVILVIVAVCKINNYPGMRELQKAARHEYRGIVWTAMGLLVVSYFLTFRDRLWKK